MAEIYALLAATCIAASSMLLSELGGNVPLLQLSRWQMLTTLVVTSSISVAWGGWRTIGVQQFWQLAASGLAGIAIASLSYVATIYILGPRINALLFSLTAPFALALGYVFLGETVSLPQAGGVVLVLAGILLAIGLPSRAAPVESIDGVARDGVSPNRGTSPLLLGLGLGVITAQGQAMGSLLARPAMATGVEPFSAMAVRSAVGAIVFLALSATPFGRASRGKAELRSVVIAVASALMGTTIGMSFIMAALHQGEVGIVSTLSSMTPILILPMVWIRTGRRPAPAAWLGTILAVGGTALISFG